MVCHGKYSSSCHNPNTWTIAFPPDKCFNMCRKCFVVFHFVTLFKRHIFRVWDGIKLMIPNHIQYPDSLYIFHFYVAFYYFTPFIFFMTVYTFSFLPRAYVMYIFKHTVNHLEGVFVVVLNLSFLHIFSFFSEHASL